MRKFAFLFFVVLSNLCFSQDKTKIDSSDVLFIQEQVLFKDLVIYLKNADDVLMPVKVNITCSEKVYLDSNMNVEKLNNMILRSYYSALYSAKNKYTFSAKKIDIYYYKPYESWNITTEFVAQNDFGALKNDKKHIFFDYNGEKEVDFDFLIKKYKKQQN